MCNQFTFHHQSGIDTWRSKFEHRQTVFFLPVDPIGKNRKDLGTIDLNTPRHAQYMHEAWKKHQKYGVLGRHQPCSEERIEVLSNSIERYHSSRNTLSLCIPKVVRMETGEVIYKKVYASPRPPPKISLKHDWMKELGSEVAQRPEGQVA